MFNWFKKHISGFQIPYTSESSPRNYQGLSRHGYMKNVIVYRCINLIAKNLSSIEIDIYENDKIKNDHPIKKLLLNPNTYNNYQKFMMDITASYLLSGNVFLYTLISDDLSSLYLLRPDRVNIELDQKGHPKNFLYEINQKKFLYGSHLSKNTQSVLHIKSYNPLDDSYGFSGIEACASAIDQHNSVGSHNLSLLKNGGRPSGALVVEDGLSDKERKNLRDSIESLYQSTKNAGRILLLEGNFKWQELGLSPKNLDFLPGKSVSAKEIAIAFGVSPLLVGLTEDASYNNYKEARLQLWEDTVIPLLNYFLTYLNNWFQKVYDIKLDFDMDKISALAKRREDTWSKLKDCNFLTINEKRQALGYPNIKGGNIIE